MPEELTKPESLEKNNPLISGDLRVQVFRLAWPTMLAMVLQTLFSLIDAFWVGKLGANALAAVSGASFILWTVYSVCHIAASGITALVAQYIGAENKYLARKVGAQGTLLAAAIGIIIGLLGIWAMSFLFSLMRLSAIVCELSSQYLSYYLAGIFLAFVYLGLESIFRASGDTKTPMIILGISLIVNGVLDPILIFGYWGLPAMGVSGAAIATVFSYFIGVIASIPILMRRELLPSLRSKLWVSLDIPLMKTIIIIGSPVAITGVAFSFVYIFLTRVISPFGSASLAALGMGHRLESIAYLACVGFSIAASTLVGQNLGAHQPERAQRAAWISTFYGSIAMGVFSIIAIFFAPEIIALFIKDQEVIMIGSQYLYIIACCEVFLAFEIVLEGSFSGAGDTLPPMLISIPLTALRYPAAYFFAIYLDLGILSIWSVISISTLFKGIVLAYWFNRGSWKHRKVIETDVSLKKYPVHSSGLSAANDH